MNERLVEDWLTKASERSYQAAFAQALLADGMQVLRVGHSPHEHGKDILAIDERGKVHAYQLKDGDLDLRGFERDLGQLTALVETQVEHPAISGQPAHQPWLVVSGRVSPPVEDRIRVQNIGWRKRRYAPLKLMTGTELVAKFIKMASNFWPQTPEDSHRLFNLYLAEGRASLDRCALAKMVAAVFAADGKLTKAEIARRLSAANLFTNYGLSPFYASKNHWELVQGWTMTAAHIAWAAEEGGLSLNMWRPTFRLAVGEALTSLEALASEALQPDALGPKGFEIDELTRSRCTICAGVLGAKVVIDRHHGTRWLQESLAKQNMERLFSDGRLVLWGESAVPFFLVLVWALDCLRGDQFSDRILFAILTALVHQNSRHSAPKLPHPYDSADEANAKVLRRLFESETAVELRATASYTLEPLVTIVARRMWRNVLAAIWSPITKTDFVRLVPDKPRDLLLWHWGHERGSNQTRSFPAPQSWRELLAESRREGDPLPTVIKEDFEFAMLFVLCFPHRLTTALVKHIEEEMQTL